MSALNSQIAAILDSYKAAVRAKDIDAFVSLYDADVQIFDMWGRWSLSGLDAWRATVADWFGSLGTEHVLVGVSGLCVHGGQDLAAAHAFLTFTAVSGEGKPLRSLDNRLTMVFRRAGDGWKIVHEHTSAPLDHGTLKGMLQRAPSE